MQVFLEGIYNWSWNDHYNQMAYWLGCDLRVFRKSIRNSTIQGRSQGDSLGIYVEMKCEK